MLSVKIEMLDQEGFKTFGNVVVASDKDVRVDNAIVTHWHDLAELSSLGKDPVVAFVNCKRRPFIVTQLERHVGTSEIFFPVKGHAAMIFATSKADGSPDMSSLRAFILSPGRPFISNRGIWHWVPFPLGDSWESFLLVEKDLIDSDLETRNLPEQVRIEL